LFRECDAHYFQQQWCCRRRLQNLESKPTTNHFKANATLKAMGGAPPPASRHRAVLPLRDAVPLFDMRANASVLARDVVISARTARPKMMSNAISTNRVSAVEDLRYLELIVIFYSTEEAKNKNKKTPPKFGLKVVMPKDWTPRMYLGALYRSIKSNRVLSLELVTLHGQSYTTINKLHWLFSSPVDVIHMHCTTSAAYLCVVGGSCQNKAP
jgi:hypothetical protein